MATLDSCQAGECFSCQETMIAPGTSSFLDGVAGFDLQMQDQAGTPLLLMPGQAQLNITIGPACLQSIGSPPGSLPGWALNLASGSWHPVGQATLVTTMAGNTAYALPLSQAGSVLVGEASDPATLKLLFDRTLNFTFDVRITGCPELKTVFADSTIQAPANKALTVEVINHKEAPGDFYEIPRSVRSARTWTRPSS